MLLPYISRQDENTIKKPTPSTKITKTQEFQDPAITSASLSPNNANPPHLLILPTHASSSARVVTLPSPATSIPSRYFFCPETGFYEFTRIAAPKKKPCSWLLAPDANAYKPLAHTPGEPEFHEYQKSGQDATEEGKIISKGYVVENPDLILATPLDPLFLIVPILSPQTSSSLDDHKQLFLSIDDHLDALAAQSKHLKHLLRNAKLRDTLTSRAVHVCDTVEAGEETMYRLSMPKLLSELVAKAAKTVEQGRLPASLEAKFVKEALQAPISSTPTAVMTDVEKEGEQERATAHKEHLSETPPCSHRSSACNGYARHWTSCYHLTSHSAYAQNLNLSSPLLHRHSISHRLLRT
ncbi:hypothetical protein H2203_007214 [Taxawa tesnikishii (nom. ined.)]|nr:hypothetical protein H2203_007214 [Dothideales sp. JES 119]